MLLNDEDALSKKLRNGIGWNGGETVNPRFTRVSYRGKDRPQYTGMDRLVD